MASLHGPGDLGPPAAAPTYAPGGASPPSARAGNLDPTSAGPGRALAVRTCAVSILLALVAGVAAGTAWQTARASATADESLRHEAAFGAVRSLVITEHADLHHYRTEPSTTARQRFTNSADAVGETLRHAQDLGSAPAQAEALRLIGEQAAYRKQAERLIELGSDPRYEQSEVTPAYDALLRDVDAVARGYSATAVRDAAALRAAEFRLLLAAGTAAALALVLAAMTSVIARRSRTATNVSAADAQRSREYDPLTGLPNQMRFMQELRDALEEAQRTGGRGVALVAISLNEFRSVTETLGSQAGEQLLVAASRRLRRVVRDVDMVGRLGAEDFVALLRDVPDLRSVQAVTDRMEETLRRDFRLQTGSAAITSSLGVVIGPPGSNPEQLLRRADAAMMQAKSVGGGVAYFNPDGSAYTLNRMDLFDELRALLYARDPDGLLAFEYQPIVRLADGRATAVEALVRWRHPHLGVLLPEDFVPVAEARGLETPLMGHLMAALAGQAYWWESAGTPLVVSLNVSPRCLVDATFAQTVRAAVESTRLAPQLLRLEITESTAITEPETALATLREIRELGVQVSIDEFGDGYGSLAQLRRLPADELKIAPSLVQNLTAGTAEEVLAQGAIETAHRLGLAVVANGVSDAGALPVLRRLGCDYAQGNAIGAPVPAEDVPAACERAYRVATASAVTLDMYP